MEIGTQRLLVRDSAGVESAVEIESGHGRHTAVGILKLLAVQALTLAAGLLIATFLTPQLGPELYGLYTVAATIVICIELSATLIFNRTTVRFLAEAADWQAVASTLAQTQLLVSLGPPHRPTLSSWLRPLNW